MSGAYTVRFIRHRSGDFRLGVWVDRRAWSVRLGWWALICARQ